MILPLFPTYVPEAQVAQVEHWASDPPEHPPLLYLPVAQVAQLEHVPSLVRLAPCKYLPVPHEDQVKQLFCLWLPLAW